MFTNARVGAVFIVFVYINRTIGINDGFFYTISVFIIFVYNRGTVGLNVG